MNKEIHIERHNSVDEKVKAVFPKFAKENFDSVDFEDPETKKEIAEWFWNPAQVHLIAYQGDTIVGLGHVTLRETTFKDEPISIACLGGLVVGKNFRGKGIASLIVEERLKIAQEWAADIAFLNTDIEKLGGLFAKHGFVPLNKNYSFIGKSGALHEDDSGMIAPISSQTKFDQVLSSPELLFIGQGNL